MLEGSFVEFEGQLPGPSDSKGLAVPDTDYRD